MCIPICFKALALAAALSSCAGAAVTADISEIAPAYAATSVNTAIFRANALATHGDTQYACFYDPDGYVTLASRPVDGGGKWHTERTPYRGNVADAHNVACIGIDGDGYLHLAFDHHGHPLRYCRSTAPGSLEMGPLETMTGMAGEDNVTYPEFHTLPGGDMLFLFRSGASGRGDMVMNRYDTAQGRWRRVHDVLIDGEGQRNAYWQTCVDSRGTLHVSWVWRETWMVETNHDVCYARSRDGGATWERSDGSPYTLPVTMASAETVARVPQGRELINQCSMDADADGRPIIAMYWRDEADSVPHYRVIEHDGTQWRSSVAVRRHTPFTLSGGGTKMIPIARPRIVAGADGAAYMLLRDAERGSRASLAWRESRRGKWRVADLTDYSVDAWEPAVDMDLWRHSGRLDVYVQRSSQGDGERVTAAPPSPAGVLSVRKLKKTGRR